MADYTVVLIDTLNDNTAHGPFTGKTSQEAIYNAQAYAVEVMHDGGEPFNASEGGYEGYRAQPGLVFNDGWQVADLLPARPEIFEKIVRY